MGKLKKEYTNKYAKSGLKEKLPKIKVFPNQFKEYEIAVTILEYTSICPRTGLPDFGSITIRYMPDKFCVELKSLKYYILSYRNLGIFYENAINRILKDFVKFCKPKWCIVKGVFNIRGGMKSEVEAKYEVD